MTFQRSFIGHNCIPFVLSTDSDSPWLTALHRFKARGMLQNCGP